MNIFVTKLDYSIDADDLRTIFEDYGTVESVKVIMDRETGRSKGYGFVEMPSEEEGEEAIRNLNDSEINGRVVVVKKSEPRNNQRSGGGGRRGGYDSRNRY